MIRAMHSADALGAVEIFGALITLVLAISIMMSSGGLPARRYLQSLRNMMLAGSVMQLADGSCYLLMGNMDHPMYCVSQISTYIMFSLFNYEYFCYVYGYIGEREQVRPLFCRICAALCTGGAVIWVLSVYTGYILDYQGGFYVKGRLYWIGQCVNLSVVVLILIMLILHRTALHRREMLAFLMYLVLPTASMLLHYMVPEVMLLFPSITVMLVVVFSSVSIQNINDLRRRKEEEKLKLFVNRLQPGILIPAITDIRHALRSDPDSAREAVDVFSSYLRENVDAVTEDSQVSIAHELDHLRDYVYLAELHYRGRLLIRIEDGQADFTMPRTVLQFLVRDAVHFLEPSMEAGEQAVITVSTEENEESFLVQIIWKGAGGAGRKAAEGGVAAPGGDAFSNIPGLWHRLDARQGASLDLLEDRILVRIAK